MFLWSLHSRRSVVYAVWCVFDSPGVRCRENDTEFEGGVNTEHHQGKLQLIYKYIYI